MRSIFTIHSLLALEESSNDVDLGDAVSGQERLIASCDEVALSRMPSAATTTASATAASTIASASSTTAPSRRRRASTGASAGAT